MRRVPVGRQFHVFEIDDVADQVHALAARRRQEIEQVARLAIAQTQVHIRDEDTAVVLHVSAPAPAGVRSDAMQLSIIV